MEILRRLKPANSIKRASIFPLNKDSWYPVTKYVNDKLILLRLDLTVLFMANAYNYS
jgi:hypothetical protein